MSLPDINKSDLSFIPDAKEDVILYGLSGITNVGLDLSHLIIENRPYSSIPEFVDKIKPVFPSLNKRHMVNLIKSGSFDRLYKNREDAALKYFMFISKARKQANMGTLSTMINMGLIPAGFEEELKFFEFNRYLKMFAYGAHYLLDERATDFLTTKLGDALLCNPPIIKENIEFAVLKKNWDKTYVKLTSRIRDWLKNNKEDLLVLMNRADVQGEMDKYFAGSISKWEMDSVSYYSHEHELTPILHKFAVFSELPEEPKIERMRTQKNGKKTPIYELSLIAGTVLDKIKNKSSITLLCGDDVVNVKIWRNQYATYDRQLSVSEGGKKRIIERSWFTKGNKLIIVGFRRGDTFVPRTYNTSKHKRPIYRILEFDESGENITVQSERGTA